MPAIESTGGVSNIAQQNGPVLSKPGGALGKDQFLKLLITQMQNQDPLKPMDSTAMIAQLAQFSALEQIQNLNGQVTGLHRDMILGLGCEAGGQRVKLELTDGSEVSGTLNAVKWLDGKMVLSVGEESYPADTIAGMTRVVEEQAAIEQLAAAAVQ